jgi:hypothetical protein
MIAKTLRVNERRDNREYVGATAYPGSNFGIYRHSIGNGGYREYADRMPISPIRFFMRSRCWFLENGSPKPLSGRAFPDRA